MAVLTGTSGNDTRIGSNADDTITTGNGNDTLFGREANDRLYGELGNDSLFGELGNDSLFGGNGSDVLFAGDGNDTAEGGYGNDSLSGGNGVDSLQGLVGNDTVAGENGADTVYGNLGNDRIFGGNGNDRVGGGDGDDTLTGGSGNDSTTADAGTDTILFSGARATYRITDLGGGVVEVVDQDATADGNDGTDRIANAELLQFKDQTVDLRVSANRAPVAVDDTLASQAEDAAARTITFASLTGNDTDADGNALTVTAVGNAAGGTVSIVSGQVRFVASANFNGAAGFDYTVSDGQGGSDVGRVSFTVTPVNDAPVAVDDVLAGQRIGAPAKTISFASLTGNDSDPDADGLTVSAVGNATGGTVSIVSGQVRFVASANFSGTAGFDYTVSDGKGGTDVGRASIEVSNPFDLDLVLGNNGGSLVTLNQGGPQNGSEGSFAGGSSLPLPFGTVTSVALGDLDGDGDLDAVAAIFNQASFVLLNQGGDQNGTAGTFELAATNTVVSNSWAQDVVLGDVDGDGDLDALVAIADLAFGGSRPSQLLVNQGGEQNGEAGTFVAEALPDSVSAQAFALGDFDGDGDLDAFRGQFAADNALLWNQGGTQGGNEGDFVATTIPSLGGTAPGTDAAAVGDLDRDGDLDIILGNAGATTQIMVNQGGDQSGSLGTFLVEDGPGGTLATSAVALGDLDGDGDLDALLGVDGENQFLWNQGGAQGGNEGDFVMAAAPGGDRNTRSVALGDLDGDGDLDAVIGNFTQNQSNQVLVNQGGRQGGTEGSFVATDGAGGVQISASVALGDLDGDGIGGLTPAGLPFLGAKLPIAADLDWTA